MKVCLLTGRNNYFGREILQRFVELGVQVDVIVLQPFDDWGLKNTEDSRCASMWRPKEYKELLHNFTHYIFSYENLNRINNFVREKGYDIGLQGGGIGIIKKDFLDMFSMGIVNFHPGDLPFYRGSSAPEWQIIESKPIICTAHFIDEKIDSGYIYSKKRLNVDMDSYAHMRASLYPRIADYCVEVVKELQEKKYSKEELTKEKVGEGNLRAYIGDEKIEFITKHWKELIKKYD